MADNCDIAQKKINIARDFIAQHRNPGAIYTVESEQALLNLYFNLTNGSYGVVEYVSNNRCFVEINKHYSKTGQAVKFYFDAIK